jgi:hypothetical protein
MEHSLEGRQLKQTRGTHGPSALGRWSRDARSPSLRLTPPAVELPEPDITAPFPLVEPEQQARPEYLILGRPEHTRPDAIQLRPISARETMPFLGRVSACPYLECRPANRRCLSADPAPVSLERQVRHCLSEGHRTCKYYRQARGLPAIAPTQAAFYTAAAVTILILIVLAGLL